MSHPSHFIGEHGSSVQTSGLRGLRVALVPIAAVALLGSLAVPALAGDCDHHGERSENQDVSGISRVEIDARAGDLEIEGQDGATQIRALGKVCASSAKLLEQIELRSRRVGDVLRLEVFIPDSKNWKNQGSMDLSVSLPANLEVEIDDGSGNILVRNATVGAVDDGSGDMRFEGTRGKLNVDDGSGDLRVLRHEGSIEVDDGSGNVDIRELQGDVRITDDGSGDLFFEDISGDVRVGDDGSGDIEARSVGGDFVVRDAGSGSVRHRDVAGRVDVPKDD